MSSIPIPRVKVKQVNGRNVVLTSEYFRKLCAATSKGMTGMGQYSPGRNKPQDLRGHFDDLYKFMASQLGDLYEHKFDPEMMTGAALESVDMVEGRISVMVLYAYLGERIKFLLRFSNEAAPYSTRWPELVRQTGGNPGNFVQLLQMV